MARTTFAKGDAVELRTDAPPAYEGAATVVWVGTTWIEVELPDGTRRYAHPSELVAR